MIEEDLQSVTLGALMLAVAITIPYNPIFHPEYLGSIEFVASNIMAIIIIICSGLLWVIFGES